MEILELNLKQTEEIYNTHMKRDFPENEIRPWKWFLSMWEKGHYLGLGLYEGGGLRAYGFFVQKHGFPYVLLDYLAVCEAFRSGGYGSRFLELMREYFSGMEGIMLECETVSAAENKEEYLTRQRRINFYMRCGALYTGAGCRMFGVDFTILLYPVKQEKPGETPVCSIMDELYHVMYTPKAYREKVSLWLDMSGEGLLAALGLEKRVPGVISLVGGGGKTTVMYELAKELERMGKRVIVTTSTHIRRPDGYQTVIGDRAEVLDRVVWDSGILAAGQEAEGGKLKGMPLEEIGKLKSYCDVLLIEADGAKGLPLKVPAGHEPVIIPETEMVIACAGLDCIGRPVKDICFRVEETCKLLGKKPEELISPRDAALILCSKQGSQKAVEGREYRIVLNKADDGERKRMAEQIIGHCRKEYSGITAVTAFEQGKMALALKFGPWKGDQDECISGDN
ncbi:selenium cofactor biosynthesis protein YqeC [Clostridium sp. MCC353]|uniref:selenium cofactor biosynthesis protein YqeC n=1 Tax=Clostridium sp. MCC353 TaxID=2592646 RepID=UPI001C01C39F|nr:selenium cofactor biosynthesis protein YqeC [Clostridium sp. MCC353]